MRGLLVLLLLLVVEVVLMVGALAVMFQTQIAAPAIATPFVVVVVVAGCQLGTGGTVGGDRGAVYVLFLE